MNESTPVRNQNFGLRFAGRKSFGDVTPVEKIPNVQLSRNNSFVTSPRLTSGIKKKFARSLVQDENDQGLKRKVTGSSPDENREKLLKLNHSNIENENLKPRDQCNSKTKMGSTNDSGLFFDSLKKSDSDKDMFEDSINSNQLSDSLLQNIDFDQPKFKPPQNNGFDEALIEGASQFTDSDFNIVEESQKKQSEQKKIDISLCLESDFSMISQQLVETTKITERIEQKLKNNVNNGFEENITTTGWSQLDLFNGSLNTSIPEPPQTGPFYGLPMKVKDLLTEHKGIDKLYDWQEECLNLTAVKERINLVYALPTSGGKTLVAELLIFKELLCNRKNVLFILPFVAIVQEKVRSLSQFALELGFSVEEYAAGKGVIPPKKRRRKNSVIVATIEKGLLVVTSLIESNRLNEFGLLVVDELHLLSEESRGATLEMLLTHVLHSKENIHVIGMTATIGNLEEVSRFLKAESYSGTFRPVQLHEYVKCKDDVFGIDWKKEELFIRDRHITSKNPKLDPDGISTLVMEVIPDDSVLIFCPTKKNCENVASLLCKVFHDNRKLLAHKMNEKLSFFRALTTETNNQVCPILRKTIPFGVAYHHSGLTTGERKLLEEAFRDGTISVICCTSTLAAGVNLPAKRVILRSPHVAKDFINLSTYKQMTGRAGRAGFGAEGESFLICQISECGKVRELLQSKMNEVTSKLNPEYCRTLILTAVGLGTADTRQKLRDLLAHTLLYHQQNKLKVNVKELTDTCITKLYKDGALKIVTDEVGEGNDCDSKLAISFSFDKSDKSVKLSNNTKLKISRLGKAAMKGGLSLEKASELFTDLIKAQENLVLLTDLHLLYLITSYEILDQIKPNYSVYFNMFMKLSNKEVITARAIGIHENMMSKLVAGIKPKNVPDLVFNRFYVSLMLNELWKNKGIWEVANAFQVSRGLVQNLMTSSSTFANNVLRFCDEMEEMWTFKSLLQDFAPRLAHCCSAELLPLLDLPAVKKGRARQLYDAGYTSLQIIATAKAEDLVKQIDHMPKRVATSIIATAKLLLLEKAENLKEEAEEVLESLITKVLS